MPNTQITNSVLPALDTVLEHLDKAVQYARSVKPILTDPKVNATYRRYLSELDRVMGEFARLRHFFDPSSRFAMQTKLLPELCRLDDALFQLRTHHRSAGARTAARRAAKKLRVAIAECVSLCG